MRQRSISILLGLAMAPMAACTQADDTTETRELQRVQAGTLDVVLLSTRDALSEGRGSFVLEFRSRAGDQLVDVGDVKVNATMPMAGMAPMIGTVTAKRTSVAGRYDVDSDLGMAGSWRIGVEWNDGAGKDSAVLLGRVQ
jgi:YtkA-like